MRYNKKPKYRLKKGKIILSQNQDLTVQQLYEERLKDKRRIGKRR